MLINFTDSLSNFDLLFRTNLPKEVMAFPDFPFPSEWSSYLSHQQVLRYLEDYTSHFDLYKYIQFNSIVNSVCPLIGKDSQQQLWEVVVTDADTKESQFFCLMLLLFAMGKLHNFNVLLLVSNLISLLCRHPHLLKKILQFNVCFYFKSKRIQ